ncbi:MAG: hypothetical protein GY862_27160 [Gammaproteobacteria bacterium]|nr:hypothetical protein [Gammaproteobacteria bacterium]
MSKFSLGLSFSRDYYLECAEQFEGSCIDCVDQELSEFGGDAEDLAYELAYTRYALAKKEAECEALQTKNAQLMGGFYFTNKQVESVIRAFWRRIYPYVFAENEAPYPRELGEEVPVEFQAHMDTALLALRLHRKPDSEGE